MTEHIVGLDLSLTSTGVAYVNVGADHAPDVQLDRWQPKSRGHLRLDYLVEQAAKAVAGATLVMLEGPAYGSAAGARQSGHHERAGLWWLVAHQVWRGHAPLVVVPPNVRAMYATGKGNAGKDDVLAAVIRRYPQAEVMGNDQADALVMAAMGARHLGLALEPALPETHKRALDKLEWPTPGVAA
jgi:crossover junction endodeoxyribonuclease RuvC